MAGRKKEPPKFSQFDEERYLKQIFKDVRRGRCADIGARGKHGSNTAYFVEEGWEAQLIDLNINGLLKDFPKNLYPNVTLVHKVITPENVNEVLWTNLDLLSIDIDGPDCDVWEAIQVRPRVLVIEVNDNEDRIMQVSESRGYKLHAKTGPNLIFT